MKGSKYKTTTVNNNWCPTCAGVCSVKIILTWKKANERKNWNQLTSVCYEAVILWLLYVICFLSSLQDGRNKFFNLSWKIGNVTDLLCDLITLRFYTAFGKQSLENVLWLNNTTTGITTWNPEIPPKKRACVTLILPSHYANLAARDSLWSDDNHFKVHAVCVMDPWQANDLLPNGNFPFLEKWRIHFFKKFTQTLWFDLSPAPPCYVLVCVSHTLG